MKVRYWLPASHHMLAIFTVVVVGSAVAIGLMFWQLLEQDRRLESRRRGVLEGVADDATRTLTAALAQLDPATIHDTRAPLPVGVTVVAITTARTDFGVTATLPFVPTRSLREPDDQAFVEARTLEFKEGGREQARAAYETLTTHPDSAVRATAFTRLGALLRKSGDLPGALRAYGALAALPDVSVGGLPAGLVAAVGRISALEDGERPSEVRAAAVELTRDLFRGKWALTDSEFESYAKQASDWLETTPPADPDAIARAEAVSWLWQRRAALPATGRKLVTHAHGVVFVAWRTVGDAVDGVVGGPAFLATLMSEAVPSGFTASVIDSDGHHALGPASHRGDVATRAASDAVPGTLKISSGAEGSPITAGPQRLLIFVMVVMVLVLGAGWYFIARARDRELRVARLQNDFIGAVSHEFRSPLTSLAHVAELLAQNRMPTDAQKQKAYGVLVSDTARLREMVEHLLDFGRFDSGTMALSFERVGIDAMVKDIVDDARQRVAALGYTIDFSPSSVPAEAEVDRVAFGRALWNLIDNAVKYSPDCRTVWVAVESDESGTAITVRDQGLGIPPGEQAGIFERFVRGEESRSRRIKGTGIGLALVRQIIDAHGGQIELTSAVGEGSRFVVRLRAAGGIG